MGARERQQAQQAMAEADAAVVAGTQSADSIPKTFKDQVQAQAAVKKANTATLSGHHEEDEEAGPETNINWSRVIGFSGLGAIALFFYEGGQRKIQALQVAVQRKLGMLK